VTTLPKGTRFSWHQGDSNLFHITDSQRQYGYVTMASETKTHPTLNAGDKVWILVDKNNIKPVQATATVPEWWSSLGKAPNMGTVVTPAEPMKIKAGAAVGHLGFYQLPEENGYSSRYQAHIECFSTDSQLPDFLSNPEGVGKGSPGFFSYPEGATIYMKHVGKLAASKLSTLTADVHALSASDVVKEQDKAAYYRVSGELYVAAADVTLVSQFDLAARGFVTIQDDLPDSFDLIDGKKPPKNVVRGILTHLYGAALKDPKTANALNHYNYQRLLTQIDSNKDGYYSEAEIVRAVHIASYRDVLYRLVVKHPSEWYYAKDDAYWKNYLDTLTTDAPLWKAYTEILLGSMNWMKGVPGMVGEPWHMHPVMFLDAIKLKKKTSRPKNVQGFLDMASDAAKAASSKWGVPASVLLAQSALESGWGGHVKNNAYFGIKGISPSGKSASFGTTEVINGKVIHIKDTFRAYADYDESADDYGRFLNENKRYKSAFDYINQPDEFITEVANAGYATDPNYASKLIKLMGSYDLYEFDN